MIFDAVSPSMTQLSTPKMCELGLMSVWLLATWQAILNGNSWQRTLECQAYVRDLEVL